MNRRLPRFMLLVVLLLSMVAVFQFGRDDGNPSNLVLAEDASCGPWAPFDPTHEPAADPDAATQVAYFSQISIQSAGESGNALNSTSLQSTIQQGEQVSFVSTGSVAIWVESGSVEVHVCTDSNVAYQQAGEDQDVVVLTTGDDPPQVSGGGSIFIGAGAEYYLTGAGSESEVFVSADRPIAIFKLCSGGGCG